MKASHFIFILFLLVISCKKNTSELYSLKGNAIGTTFSIKYIATKEIKNISYKIDSIITAVNKSVSTYMPNSTISKINRGDTTVAVDTIFKEVYLKSKKIVKETNGIFDPTIGVLVNAWGFGPEKEIENLNEAKITELMQLVGFEKVQLRGNKIHKNNPNIYFDFNATAKGFLIDLIGRMFEKHKISNYLVEVGGEIRAKGKNAKNNYWQVAIENPNTDGTRSFITTIALKNESMATSGNYRKFKRTSDGKKYVHIINAKTGYATESNLLSASVIAKTDCADVDAYATAFMAIGLEKTKEFLKTHPKLKVFLIYTGTKGDLKTYQTIKS